MTSTQRAGKEITPCGLNLVKIVEYPPVACDILEIFYLSDISRPFGLHPVLQESPRELPWDVG